MKRNEKILIVLAGATGSGKTELCLQLSGEIYEIVSFDSRQVYKFLEAGTAKPNQEEREKISHHLIDFLEPTAITNAKEFSKMAEDCILEIWQRKKIPILTVGTFFYLKAFLYGMFLVPEIPKLVKEKIQNMKLEDKWKALREYDEISTYFIHPNDEYRITRALEVTLSGIKWSEVSKTREEGFLKKYEPKVFGYYLFRERKELYERIDTRAKLIFENGIIRETELVMEKFGEDCPALETLGYSFIIQYLKGEISKENALELFSRAHRNYAKRQMTWFKQAKWLLPLSKEEIYSKLCLQEF